MDLTSTVDETRCICDASNENRESFGASFIAPPNTIDFTTVWSKCDLKNNAAVFSVVISLIVLYIILFIWARIMDKRVGYENKVGYTNYSQFSFAFKD